MGTETFHFCLFLSFVRSFNVKLNNPLMGTETNIKERVFLYNSLVR